ncbi:RNA polymerase sporulation sigma factor SigG [Intestinibacillus massiliensis]|uniref:RNA polymerase sporulation sigma factor SigG n=1 Tax=Intestinibacillus massiliensis TaxID=1871029 RepID=UPI000B34CE13|nr:RNA polymerase sporulation sigma factor SigG [Intestinibacillus massiliensis]MCB6365155.1 RNA polymerase sporulation sigma factor SigG [Intestinibacillus massiliensis]
MQMKVEICGVNTSKLTVLSGEEMNDLLHRVRDGDQAAREKLISGNLRLVLSVIQRFGGRGESVDDLFQVGCIGLIKSIDNFNVDLGVRFSTYAVPMIIGEIRRYLRDNSAIRVSRSMRDMAYRALQAKEAFVRDNQREPTIMELANSMGVKKEEVVFALDAIMDPVSLFEPVWGEEGDTICVMDQVGDTKNTDEHWLEQIALKQAIGGLSDREKRIVQLRFFEGRTQMEVAKEIHISQAQVSRLEKGALERIRKQI